MEENTKTNKQKGINISIKQHFTMFFASSLKEGGIKM
jgi:hypothetical protein